MKYFIIVDLRQLFLGLLVVWILPFALSGQRYISGHITDAESGEPVSGASVFMAGTNVGAASDVDGFYRLTIPVEGSYRLVISHVGYQPVINDIESGDTSVVFDATLNANELDEVSVSARVRFRSRDINLFWSTILGKRPSKKTIYAVNPETVYYYYNAETRILKVTCRKPLEIINNETGYRVQVVLENFTHNYHTNISSWKTQTMFSELEPENDRQKTVWENNRKKVYNVSLANFIIALYHNTWMEKGYLLTYLTKKDLPDSLTKNNYLNPDVFLSTPSHDGGKMLSIPSFLENLILVCFGRPITKNDLDDVDWAQNGLMDWTKMGLLQNMFQTSDTIRIFPNGTYKGQLKFNALLSNSLVGVSMNLPTGYTPQIDSEVMPLATATDSIAEDLLTDRFVRQLSLFPQEKIFLHTDKPYYISGEKIWFRAHLVDAATHIPVAVSRYVYVELINPLDSVVTRLKIRETEGAYHGHLTIPEEVPEGDYTLRAYTTFMCSQDENYFFTKTIRIGDPQSREIHAETQFAFSPGNRVDAVFRFTHAVSSAPLVPQSAAVSVNGGRMMNLRIDDDDTASFNFNTSPISSKGEGLYSPIGGVRGGVILMETSASNSLYRKYIRIPTPDDDFDVAFYPEGGYLVQDAFCKIAFKAMKSNGQAAHISGTVYDPSGVEITKLKSEHLGMGNFLLFADQGKTWYAVCENEKGQTKRFDLPAAVAHGYALSINRTRDRIHVSVLKPARVTPNEELYLLAHTRGMVQYVDRWDHKQNLLTFREEQFPSGVLHFILLDTSMTPLSERLIFINSPDQAQVQLQSDREAFLRRSPVKNRVTLTDGDGEPLAGNFSVSVTSDREIQTDSTSNILTQLLLTSDLRGHIENPAFYFQNTLAAENALDLLMRTQGWRRYDITGLAQGRYTHPSMPLELSAEITGTVKSVLTGRAAGNVKVSLMAQVDDGYVDETVTDSDGRFSFAYDLPDSTMLIVSAVQNRGLTRMNLLIDEETFPIRELSAVPSAEIDGRQFAIYAGKAEQQFRSEGGIRMYDLPEITVTAARIPPRQSAYYSMASVRSITEEELEKEPPIDIVNLLQRIPGVIVYRDPTNKLVVTIGREVITILLENEPLLMIDNVIFPFDFLEDINVYEIAQIDVLNRSNAVVFGSQGANGAIVIYTKKGENSKIEIPPFHIKNIFPLGYQQPVEFYTPKYDTPEKRNAPTPDLRTTIHWQPVVRTDSEGVASFEFYTADDQTNYTVVIEGLANDGSIIRKEEKLFVND